MYPWRKILVPTDFSTAAGWVFDDAIRAAAVTGAEVIILHVRLTQTTKPGELRFPVDPQVYEYVEQQELELLERYVERANRNIRTTLMVRRGPDAAEEIFRAVREHDVDLLAMATHARHHIAHLFIGSSTMKMLSRCTVPILAIRYGIKKGLGMGKIVVPVDAEKSFPTLIRTVAAIAEREHSSVSLLCCASAADRPRAENALREIESGFAGNVHSTIVETKNLDKELIRRAEAEGASLIAIPPDCDRTGQLSGTAEGVVRHATTAVLVVPEE